MRMGGGDWEGPRTAFGRRRMGEAGGGVMTAGVAIISIGSLRSSSRFGQPPAEQPAGRCALRESAASATPLLLEQPVPPATAMQRRR